MPVCIVADKDPTKLLECYRGSGTQRTTWSTESTAPLLTIFSDSVRNEKWASDHLFAPTSRTVLPSRRRAAGSGGTRVLAIGFSSVRPLATRILAAVQIGYRTHPSHRRSWQIAKPTLHAALLQCQAACCNTQLPTETGTVRHTPHDVEHRRLTRALTPLHC